ncbi:MAG: hypothetical protein CM1200mP30_25670 [Pseudomonadota bacterium]|nr:MAG: hypothetical protein CM1200mP30_25670 [Pseudomonadota bacterium]
MREDVSGCFHKVAHPADGEDNEIHQLSISRFHHFHENKCSNSLKCSGLAVRKLYIIHASPKLSRFFTRFSVIPAISLKRMTCKLAIAGKGECGFAVAGHQDQDQPRFLVCNLPILTHEIRTFLAQPSEIRASSANSSHFP